MNKQAAATLKAELRQFTGSEVVYKHPLFPRFIYTEGVKYLAGEAGAYWLLEYIFSHQVNDSIKAQSFQVWKLRVSPKQNAVIRVEDGNDHEVASFNLNFTDFPLEEITLWLVGNTLLLPGEY